MTMYGWTRRLVYNKMVSGPLEASRGIVAGSAYATMELWLMLAPTIGRLVRRYAEVVWCVHVDDISGTLSGRQPEKVAVELGKVFKDTKEGIEQECGGSIADAKNAVVATSEALAKQVVQQMGCQAAAGTTCRKLGADYSFFGGDAFEKARRAASRPLAAGGGPQAAAGGGLARRARQRRCADAKCAERERRAVMARRAREKAGGKKIKPSSLKVALPVRAQRLAKAARRLRRMSALKAGGRRMFVQGIFPVAHYAAEHDAWSTGEVRWMQSAALQCFGTAVPAVPHEACMITVPVEWDAQYRMPLAAVERLARETWMSTAVGSERPPDVLTGFELYKLQRMVSGETSCFITGGPLKALREGMRSLGLIWNEPMRMQHGDFEWDMAGHSPELLKLVLKKAWGQQRRDRIRNLFEQRLGQLRARGKCQIDELGQIDLEFVLDMLQSERGRRASKKVLIAIIWGTLPTPQWLADHSWKVEATCCKCGELDGLMHALMGCFVEGPRAVQAAAVEWRDALVGPGIPEPTLQDTDVQPVETLNGFRVPAGTVRFQRGVESGTDGSCEHVGLRFASASGAAVQLGTDGILRSIAGPVPKHLPQCAVCGESYAVGMLGEVLGRGDLEEQEPHQPRSVQNGIDCSSVIVSWAKHEEGEKSSFPYRGFFRIHGTKAGSPFKVDAHQPEFQAVQDGWHTAWKSNDTADWLAKEARAKWAGNPSAWIKDRRRRAKLLIQLLESMGPPDTLWSTMFRERPEAGRNRALAKGSGLASHVLTATRKGWSCLVCGTAFRSYQRAATSECPGRLPAATGAHSTHNLHTACFQEDGARGDLQQLILCVNCGAHGTARVANLGRPCPAAAGRPPEKHDAHRRQASMVARGLHPSRKRVRLLNLRPLQKVQERMSSFPLCGVGGTECVICNAGPGEDEQPEEKAELEQLEAMEAEARCFIQGDHGMQLQDDDGDDDVFGHGGELGEAAYVPVQQAAVEAVAALPAPAPQPPPKAPRAVAEEPRAKKARRSKGAAVVVASLEGVEARLLTVGETPRFAVVDPSGRQLQHRCTTADARVNFWPGTLQWSVEGPHSAFIEDALLSPVDEEGKPNEPRDAAVS